MKKRVFIYFIIIFLSFVSLLFSSVSRVDLLTIDGPIGPITARIIEKAIKSATDDNSEALVIELNTPGGLDESTRLITRQILNSEVPIIVYVSPSGSRAASAGVFITLSAHIAAMVPGTNIGAAHPVSIGGQIDSVMEEKVTNDAVAYIKSISNKRGRNAEWAESSIRQSVSITETEALESKVIDYVANNLRELLDLVDGRKVELPSGERILKTKASEVRKIEIGWRDRILEVISSPTIAYILFTLGMWGLFFELSNPGSILPGIVGGICIILAFFAFQSLPINYAGVLLIFLAIILFVAEIKVVSHGALTIGGIISMVLGSLMLINSPAPYMRVSLTVILTVVIATALFFFFVVGMGIKAQRKKVTTGDKGMLGEIGVARTEIKPEGYVNIHGEIWRAECDPQTDGIEKGEKVKVVGISKLTLKVTKV
ncbi:MAG: nodulation protein NfeD [candidate division Zixibacteria bacterium]|nr:nodulation protein NfeD [candidate division Zixibacteria bacterium]